MAYIKTSEVKAVREELKKQFPNVKFSVRHEDHTSIHVAIMKSDVDYSDIIWFGYADINVYHIENYGVHTEFLEKVLNIIKTAGREWFDKSDSQTDYFHTAFYIYLEIGKCNKPYMQVNA